MIVMISGCRGIRISNLPDRYIETKTKKGVKTHTVATKVKGEVVGEVITTDEWNEEEKTDRPYQWQDYGSGYGYGRYGGYYR